MNRSIIFCQAPLKIPTVLNCYEHELNAEHRSVMIVVRNTEASYRFVNSLRLDAKVLFLSNNSDFSFPYLKLRKSVKEDLEVLKIDDIKNTRVFFTDVCDDPLMGCYLAALKGTKVFKIQSKLDILQGEDRIANRESVPFRLRVKELVMSFLLGYSYRFTKIDHWTPTLNIKKYSIPVLDYSDMEICKRYQYKIPSLEGKPSVLLLTEPYRNKFQTKEDYDTLNIRIVKDLQAKGFSVGVKGHPRIGCQKDAAKIADYEIPPYIPAEFINMSEFSFVIGFVSSSLCSASAQAPAYSVLPMCDVINQIEADYWYDYLTRLSDNRVTYIKNFSEIKIAHENNRRN